MTVAELIERLRGLPQHLPAIAYNDGFPLPAKADLLVSDLAFPGLPGSVPVVIIEAGSQAMTVADLIETLGQFDGGLPAVVYDDSVYDPAEPSLVPPGDFRWHLFEQESVVI
ncbi:MAG: hypothetical protein EON58_02435 [Alphaproteobacteria bacterium]|nr:MAG: hypothetical protein EON58_02435 [Alphaproteobacteria bacterium]